MNMINISVNVVKYKKLNLKYIKLPEFLYRIQNHVFLSILFWNWTVIIHIGGTKHLRGLIHYLTFDYYFQYDKTNNMIRYQTGNSFQ